MKNMDNRTEMPAPRRSGPAGASETPRQGVLTLFFAGLGYVIFHLRLGQSLTATVLHTLAQMLLTAPYTIGFTFILISVYRRISGQQQRPPWTRVLRIFFAVGICFAFFFALYEYGGGDPYAIDTRAGDFWRGVFQQLRLH